MRERSFPLHLGETSPRLSGTMSTRIQLLDRIAAFRERHGLTERQFGIEAVGDHRLISRLRDSETGVTLTTIDRAEAFMAQRDGGDARPGDSASPSGEAA